MAAAGGGGGTPIEENPIPDVVYSGISEEAYNSLLMKLFPKGRAWVGQNIETLMMAFAKEIKRASDTIEGIINNALPNTTIDYLTDWERVCGITLVSQIEGLTESQRRSNVISKLRATGGQSPQYFIEIAANMGYQIQIEDHIGYFHAGSIAGAMTLGVSFSFAFIVHVTGSYSQVLEDTINRLKPAHTVAIFEYV